MPGCRARHAWACDGGHSVDPSRSDVDLQSLTSSGTRSFGFTDPPAPFACWTMAYSRSRQPPAWWGRVISSRDLALSLKDLRPSSDPHLPGQRWPGTCRSTSHEVWRPFSAPTRGMDSEEPHTTRGQRPVMTLPARRPEAYPCRRDRRRCPSLPDSRRIDCRRPGRPHHDRRDQDELEHSRSPGDPQRSSTAHPTTPPRLEVLCQILTDSALEIDPSIIEVRSQDVDARKLRVSHHRSLPEECSAKPLSRARWFLVAGFHTRFAPPSPFLTTLTVYPSPGITECFIRSRSWGCCSTGVDRRGVAPSAGPWACGRRQHRRQTRSLAP